MSNLIFIDPLKFAREGRSLNGNFLLSELDERVRDELSGEQGSVSYTLTGFSDKLSRLAIRLVLKADIQVACQRCMESMPFRVESDSVITLFTSEAKLESACSEDDELDAILAEPELNIRALIEDEIIMGLPLSPKHEVCGESVMEKAKSDKPNPFAVLASLKLSKPE